jgi:hypothetical protein
MYTAVNQFFVKPAEVINRSSKSVEHFDPVGRVSSGGCNCVNCRSCDNKCNK